MKPQRLLRRPRGRPAALDPLTNLLQTMQKRSGLSIQEMADWLGGISPPTMRSWLHGRVPADHTQDRIKSQLVYLDQAVKAAGGAIIPLDVRQKDRRAYVQRIRERYPSV